MNELTNFIEFNSDVTNDNIKKDNGTKFMSKRIEKWTLIGDQIKQWEESTPTILSNSNWTVIRIDGHRFSTYTKVFNKPIDDDLAYAMIETTKDLCKTFSAIGYTQSDEITLLIKPTNIDPKTEERYPMMFSGRKQKLETLTAGFASARFNYHISDRIGFLDMNRTERKRDRMVSGTAYFDSRAISLNELNDVIKIFQWRHTFDCFRNGISSLFHYLFSFKKTVGINLSNQIKMIIEKEPNYLEKYPHHLFYGTFIKKEFYKIKEINRRTNNVNESIRSRYATVSLHIVDNWKNFLELYE